MTPTIGRIVLYTLAEQDCDYIREKMLQAQCNPARFKFLCNYPLEGQVYPMIVTRSDSEDISGQVFLDGHYTYWAGSVTEGMEPRQWHWPPRV